MKIVTMKEAAALLLDGKIGVIPTDTVYGVVCSATDERAVQRLYELKSRDAKPGTIIAAHIDELSTVGVEQVDNELLMRYWPGPVSIVLPSSAQYLHQGIRSLAIRVPAHVAVHDTLIKTGPLLTSSANQPGLPPATTINEAYSYFGENVDFYVDAGYLSNENASTIIRFNDGIPEILRQGVFTIEAAQLKR